MSIWDTERKKKFGIFLAQKNVGWVLNCVFRHGINEKATVGWGFPASLDLESLSCNSLQRNPTWSLLIYSTGDGEKAKMRKTKENQRKRNQLWWCLMLVLHNKFILTSSHLLWFHSSNIPNRMGEWELWKWRYWYLKRFGPCHTAIKQKSQQGNIVFLPWICALFTPCVLKLGSRKEMKSVPGRDICTFMFIEALFIIAKIGRQPKWCPSYIPYPWMNR